jgi:hypothetical protein
VMILGTMVRTGTARKRRGRPGGPGSNGERKEYRMSGI